MTRQVQLRRGTTTENNNFTGATGEITIDTETNEAVLHDGSTQGGHRLGKSGKSFDSVASMKSAKELKVGDLVQTKGYYTPNDGGQGQYLVVAGDTGTDDGGTYHDLTSGLQVELIQGDHVHAKQYGCKMDGVTDDSAPFQKAIARAQLKRQVLKLGIGDLHLTNQITLSGEEITIEGEHAAPVQNGSDLANTTISWGGGAVPMITVSSTYFNFIGFGVENRGTATDFMEVTLGLGYLFQNVSFVNGSGHTPFTRSCIRSSGNRLGYARFRRCVCLGAAPFFIDIDGQGTSNGITPVLIEDRCLFESTSGNAMTVVNIKDEALDALTIRDCTFNQQADELTAVSTFDTPNPRSIDVFTFVNNEWDKGNAVGAVNDSVLKLENVQNAIIDGNHWNGNGVTNLIDMRNTVVTSFHGNYVRSVAGTVFKALTDCLISVGTNNMDLTNTKGIVPPELYVIPVTYAPTMSIYAWKAPTHGRGIYLIEPTDVAAFSISNPTLDSKHSGQVITILVRNTTGGAIANLGFSGASWIRTGGSFISPATGFEKSITFRWDGENSRWKEIYRDAGDVPIS